MGDVKEILSLLLKSKKLSELKKSDASGFILQFILKIPGGNRTIDIHLIPEIMENLRYLKSIAPTKGVLFTSVKKSERPCEIFQPMKCLRIIKDWKANLLREEKRWLNRKSKWEKQHGAEQIFPEKPPVPPPIPPLAFTSFRPGTIYFYFTCEATLPTRMTEEISEGNTFGNPRIASRQRH